MHRSTHQVGHLSGALIACGDRVRGLVLFHLFDDRAAALICCGQPLQMAIQVALDLTLSADDLAAAGHDPLLRVLARNRHGIVTEIDRRRLVIAR